LDRASTSRTWHLDLDADLEQFGGVLDLLGPAHLADVDEAFDARFELDEGAVVGEAHHLAAHPLADRIGLLGVFQGSSWVCLRPRTPVPFRVVLEDFDRDFVRRP